MTDLEQVGIGCAIFLGAYLSNMGLGAWKGCKIDGMSFNWKRILNSVYKFVVLSVSIVLLTVVVTIIPLYATYTGLEIDAELLKTISALTIIGSFTAATLHYIGDSFNKIRAILGLGE